MGLCVCVCNPWTHRESNVAGGTEFFDATLSKEATSASERKASTGDVHLLSYTTERFICLAFVRVRMSSSADLFVGSFPFSLPLWEIHSSLSQKPEAFHPSLLLTDTRACKSDSFVSLVGWKYLY